jgi:hypothetical protein
MTSQAYQNANINACEFLNSLSHLLQKNCPEDNNEVSPSTNSQSIQVSNPSINECEIPKCSILKNMVRYFDGSAITTAKHKKHGKCKGEIEDILGSSLKKDIIPSFCTNTDKDLILHANMAMSNISFNNSMLITPVRKFDGIPINLSVLVMVVDRYSIITFINSYSEISLPYFRFMWNEYNDRKLLHYLKVMYCERTLGCFPRCTGNIWRFVYDKSIAIFVMNVDSSEIKTGRMKYSKIKAVRITSIGSILLALKGVSNYVLNLNSAKILNELLPHLGYM